MTQRIIHCIKLGEDLPGLEKPPFPGETGQHIYEKVSARAWSMWRDDLQMKVLNEYRLNMADPKDYQVLVDQMLTFLNLKSGDVAEVENEKRGRSQD
jgi:Fe-S cluster biosynthesis and repair protein YggX